MKLTDDDKKIINRMRVKEEAWCTWGKWILLLGGVGLALYYLGLIASLDNQRLNPLRAVMIQSDLPYLVLSIVMVKVAVNNWHGTARSILLRMVDAEEEKK